MLDLKNAQDMKVEYFPLDYLKSYSQNPRIHSKKQIEQIASSIRAFGFTSPILATKDGGIIAGHARLEAARLLNMKSVPVISLHTMTEAQRRAYLLADNKIAENSDWDTKLLAQELRYLNDQALEFELSVLGFEIAEIDILINNEFSMLDENHFDNIKDKITNDIVTVPGDLWSIGEHRILCGDALDLKNHRILMDENVAQVIFIDPPYNVPIDGHVCGKGKNQHSEFPMASGDLPKEGYIALLSGVFNNLKSVSKDGSIHYVCMDWRHIEEIMEASKNVYEALLNVCVWNKNNGGMGSFYRSKHELIFVFKNGKSKHINNVQLGKHGRYRTNVWDYAGVNTFKKDREKELEMHPTVKPVAMVADAILDCSKPKDIVLDCFGGSGTTLIAAEIKGRTAYLMEMDPKYVDVTIKRYQSEFGGEAIHLESGLSYEAIKKQRSVRI